MADTFTQRGCLEKVTAELTCPICLEVAQSPVNFLCFRGCGGKYSAGSTCLRSVLCMHCANEALQLRRTPAVRFPESSGFTRCLICRETRVDSRVLTPENAYALNHNVAAIMDALGYAAMCRSCEQPFDSQSSLHQHYLRRCPAAVVRCRFRGCAHWHSRRDAPAHEDTCSVGRGQCGQCGAWVDRSDMLHHMVATCRLRVVNCVLCSHSALLPDMLEHLRLHQSRLQGQVGVAAAAQRQQQQLQALPQQQQSAQVQAELGGQPMQAALAGAGAGGGCGVLVGGIPEAAAATAAATTGGAGGGGPALGASGSGPAGPWPAGAPLGLMPAVANVTGMSAYAGPTGVMGASVCPPFVAAPDQGQVLMAAADGVAAAAQAGAGPAALSGFGVGPAAAMLQQQQPWHSLGQSHPLRESLRESESAVSLSSVGLGSASPPPPPYHPSGFQSAGQVPTPTTQLHEQQPLQRPPITPLDVQQQAQRLLLILLRRQRQQLLSRQRESLGLAPEAVRGRAGHHAGYAATDGGYYQTNGPVHQIPTQQARQASEQNGQQTAAPVQSPFRSGGGVPGPLAAAAALHLTRTRAGYGAYLSAHPTSEHPTNGGAQAGPGHDIPVSLSAPNSTFLPQLLSHVSLQEASIADLTTAFSAAAAAGSPTPRVARRTSADWLRSGPAPAEVAVHAPSETSTELRSLASSSGGGSGGSSGSREGTADEARGPEQRGGFSDVIRRRGAFWPAELDDTLSRDEADGRAANVSWGDGGAGGRGHRPGSGEGASMDVDAEAEAAETARLVRTAAAIVRASRSMSHRGCCVKSHLGSHATGASPQQGAPDLGSAWWGIAGRGAVGTAADRTESCGEGEDAGPDASAATTQDGQFGAQVALAASPGRMRRSLSDTELVFDVLEELVRASSNGRPGERCAVRVSASGL